MSAEHLEHWPEIDGEILDAIDAHARLLLQILPADWRTTSWHKEPEIIQKAFFVLLACGLTRCRMAAKIKHDGWNDQKTVYLEIMDGFNADAVIAEFRKVAGAADTSTVVWSPYEWGLSARGLSKRDRILRDAGEWAIELQRRVPLKSKPLEYEIPPFKNDKASADTQKFLSAMKPTACGTSRLLAQTQWEGVQAGQTIEAVNLEFREKQAGKLGKTIAERDKEWSRVSKAARRIWERYNSTE